MGTMKEVCETMFDVRAEVDENVMSWETVEILAEDAESAVERAEELVNEDVIQPEVYYDDYDRDCRVVDVEIKSDYPTQRFE